MPESYSTNPLWAAVCIEPDRTLDYENHGRDTWPNKLLPLGRAKEPYPEALGPSATNVGLTWASLPATQRTGWLLSVLHRMSGRAGPPIWSRMGRDC